MSGAASSTEPEASSRSVPAILFKHLRKVWLPAWEQKATISRINSLLPLSSLNPLRQNHVDNYALTFYGVINADVFTADERLADDEPLRKSRPVLGRGRWQRQLRSRLNAVSHQIGCLLGCGVAYAA